MIATTNTVTNVKTNRSQGENETTTYLEELDERVDDLALFRHVDGTGPCLEQQWRLVAHGDAALRRHVLARAVEAVPGCCVERLVGAALLRALLHGGDVTQHVGEEVSTCAVVVVVHHVLKT